MGVLFDDLPIEIIHSVLVYVLDSSPYTAKALSHVNKCLLEAVKVIRSRRKTIVLNKDGKIDDLKSTSPSAFEHTHHLTFEASKNPLVSFSDTAVLVGILGTIKNLKTLIWNVGPIPNEVLAALQDSHPTCTLRIFKWWRFDHLLNHLDESEIALSKFDNLTHLRYVNDNLGSGSILDAPYAWEVFREIVAMSRSLELASFLVNFRFRNSEDSDWQGVVLTPSGQAGSNFKIRYPKTKYPKSLTIDCPDLRLSSATLHQIGGFTDLTAIEYLKISRGRMQLDYFQTAATLLPNLKHISLNFAISSPDLRTAARLYLLACSPAQTLSLWKWSPVIELQELLEHHGETLKVLQLHDKEDVMHGFPRKELDCDDIKVIEDLCPNLIDLTIDTDVDFIEPASGRAFELEPETLEALKSLVKTRPQVCRLQLYHESEDLFSILYNEATESERTQPSRTAEDESDEDSEQENDEDEDDLEDRELNTRALQPENEPARDYREKYIVPLVTPYVTELWKTLFGHSTVGEKVLDVKFGEWEATGNMYEEDVEPRTYCSVRPNERDDRKGECVVKTRIWSKSDL